MNTTNGNPPQAAVQAAVLRFLSLCLLYPEPDLLAAQQAAAQATGQDWAIALAARFAATDLEALQIEHTRLFINNQAGVPCPPYESAYVDGQLLTATTAAVGRFYAAWGLEQDQETPDYLPTELQFAAYLLELSAEAEEEDEGAAAQAALEQFNTQHLSRWLEPFARDLQTHAQQDAYRVLAEHLFQVATKGLRAGSGGQEIPPRER